MLVIRRRAGESVLIADDIEVEILDLSQSHVKLGIRAPKTVSVLRGEVKLAREQNVAAAALRSLEDMEGVLDILRAGRANTSNKLS